jgi:hypothetical protein
LDSPSPTPEISETFSPVPTAPSTEAASPGPSPSMSPQASPSASVTPGQSATESESPTNTPHPSPTATFLVHATASPSPSSTVPGNSGASSPVPSSDSPGRVTKALMINPVLGNQGRLMLQLSGVVHGLELRVFGVSEVLERAASLPGSYGPGWVEVDVDTTGLADGLYYAQANGVVAKWVKLR